MIDQAFQLFDQILNFKNQSLLLNGKMKEIVFQDVEHEKSLTEKNGLSVGRLQIVLILQKLGNGVVLFNNRGLLH